MQSFQDPREMGESSDMPLILNHRSTKTSSLNPHVFTRSSLSILHIACLFQDLGLCGCEQILAAKGLSVVCSSLEDSA